jgi:sec-independent protein translocase protein TatA
VLLFGGKKIGDLGKGLGEGIRNFKTAMKDEESKDLKSSKEDDKVETKK